ncbi:hypothetical protein [Actinacidiphila oryziradicis]|uniref:Uncharacterized protein n=1 Tax=Actinacidiphila oryziradicis TaxID=2571141 RepID=A0A4U0S6I7_9ACTN|nr:hypothetical protein [Actinacidiphila oryziradicis]TKA04724.1 hypothetical protein FCI23_34730 [Actinacidiphila oryziradicis]
MTAAAWANISDRADVDAVAEDAEAGIRADVDRALDGARAQGATGDTLALLARITVETAAAEYRGSALALLARSPEADTEAKLANEKMRSWHRFVTRAAAKEAAGQARARVAGHLLATRTAALLTARPAAGTPPVDDGELDPYAAGAAQVRAAMRTRVQRTGPLGGMAARS